VTFDLGGEAFVFIRLDYCKSVLYSINENIISATAVSSSQAGQVDRSRCTHHIGFMELHWLPVRRRVDFKLAILMVKSLHGLKALYLSEECQHCW